MGTWLDEDERKQAISETGISLADASILCTALRGDPNKDSLPVIHRVCYHSSQKPYFRFCVLYPRVFLYVKVPCEEEKMGSNQDMDPRF